MPKEEIIPGYRTGSSEMSEPPSIIPWWVASLGSPPPSLPVTGLHRTAGLPSSESTRRHQRFPLKDSQHAHTRDDRSTVLSASLDLLPHKRSPPSHRGGRKERLPTPAPFTSPARSQRRPEPEKTPKQAPRRGGPRETGKCQGSPKPKCKNSS